MSKENKRQTLVTPETSGLSRRRYLAALSLLAGPALAGCSDSPTESQESPTETQTEDGVSTTVDESEITRGGELVSTLESSIEGLDPSLAALIVNHTVIMRVIEKPFTVNQDLEFEEALAEDVTISDDGETWDIKFREGVMFHPPYDHELTAEDVVRSFDHMSADGTVWQQAFNIVNNYEAVDDYTVQMELSGPAASLEGRLGYRAGYIMPKEVFDNDDVDLKNNPVGSGPFKFEEWQTRDHITLSAHENYWQEDLPYVDELTFRPISEASVKVTELTDGNVDIIRDTPADFVSRLRNDDSVTVEMKKSGTIRYLQNNASPKPTENRAPGLPTTDKKIRHAIAEAIDRNAMVNIIEAGFGTPTQTWYPETSPWDIDADYSAMAADPEAAKTLIDESEFERPVEINILSSPDLGALKQMGRITRDNLKQAGFDPNLRELEVGSWVEEQFAWRWDICVNFSGYWPEPDLLRNQFIESFGGWQPIDGHTEYDVSETKFHKEVKRLVEEGRQNFDQQGRFEALKELQELVYDYLPVVPLYHPTWVHSYRNDVKNYSVHPYKPGYDVHEVWLDE